MSTLRSLQGQFPGFHYLTLFLKVFKLSISLQCSDSMPHIFGLKNETLSLSWYNDLTSGLEYSEICLKLCRLSLRERCPNRELFLIRIQENTDQKTPHLHPFHAVNIDNAQLAVLLHLNEARKVYMTNNFVGTLNQYVL